MNIDVESAEQRWLGELIDLVKNGEPAAAAYLVSACGAKLASYIRMIAPDLGQTDQELIGERAVERAVEQIVRFDPEKANFDAWVRGFARYVLLEFRRGVSTTATDPAVLNLQPATGDEETEAHVANPMHEILARGIANLRPTDQLIINLRDYEQLSYESISGLLNVEVAACRQRHARALARLRQQLEDLKSHSDDTGEE